MRVQEINGHTYKLPNKLTDFQQDMYVHLIKWKWEHITRDVGYYKHNEKLLEYDAILPTRYREKGEFPHIHSANVENLAAHHRRNPFRYHPHFYHMSSSQAANINLFLPILCRPNASKVLADITNAPKDFKTLATDQFDHGYCLEYWGGNFDADKSGNGPLNDKSARAGTDSDIAIAYRNHQGDLCLWLIEHKLVEAEFTTCGGFKSKGRTDKVRHDCTRSFSAILRNKNTCYYHDVCKYRYWDITDANRGFFANHAKYEECPFQGGMNQLWRNQLLALAIEREGKPFKHAHFSVVHHPANEDLKSSLNDYKAMIAGNLQFSVFTSKDVIQAAETQGDDKLQSWATWYRCLYKIV